MEFCQINEGEMKEMEKEFEDKIKDLQHTKVVERKIFRTN